MTTEYVVLEEQLRMMTENAKSLQMALVAEKAKNQSIPNGNLTETERDHLLTLLAEAKAEGNYYGNRDQYWRRHERIVFKLTHGLAVRGTR
jgi:hypothetical protein